MTARRALAILLAALALAAAIVVMIRYTKRVETDLRQAPATGASVRLLKDRAAIPPLTGADLDGRRVDTATLRGKVVLVNFWATWCPPCREEIPDLVALQQKYKDKLQIIGISEDEDGPAKVRPFAQQKGMNYPIVMATSQIIG